MSSFGLPIGLHSLPLELKRAVGCRGRGGSSDPAALGPTVSDEASLSVLK